jgi:hypothetical protein
MTTMREREAVRHNSGAAFAVVCAAGWREQELGSSGSPP